MKYVIFTILIFSAFSVSSCFQNTTPEEIENIISKSYALERVNRLCLNIQKPDGFNFIRKGLNGNAVTASVAFYYLSNKKSGEIKVFYKRWANENGWELSEGNRFIKEKQTIVLEFENINNSNVVISCQEPY